MEDPDISTLRTLVSLYAEKCTNPDLLEIAYKLLSSEDAHPNES